MNCEGQVVTMEGFNYPHRACIIILPRQDVEIQVLYGISNFLEQSVLEAKREITVLGFILSGIQNLVQKALERKPLCNSYLNTRRSAELCSLEGTSRSCLVQPAAQSSGSLGRLLRILSSFDKGWRTWRPRMEISKPS